MRHLTGKSGSRAARVIDAETGSLAAKMPSKKSCHWKTGSFEILPAEPNRPRTIHSSYHGLLLDSAQAMDESHTIFQRKSDTEIEKVPAHLWPSWRNSRELNLFWKRANDGQAPRAWGVENPEVMLGWAKQTRERLKGIGNLVQAGPSATSRVTGCNGM